MSNQRQEIIQFLSENWEKLKEGVASAGAKSQPPSNLEFLTQLVQLRSGYVAELEALTNEQLLSAFGLTLTELEKARPFHQPGTEADFEHFGRCAYLTVAEAVTLSLGKDPRVVNWEMVQPYLGISPFAQDFADRLDLVERSVRWGELSQAFPPLTFLTWAHRFKIEVPQEFVRCTFVRGEPIRYWHDLCIEQNTMIAGLREQITCLQQTASRDIAAAEQKNIDDWLGSLDEIENLEKFYRDELALLQQELAAARSANEALQNKLEALEADDKTELSRSERKSLLTIVIASAVDCYGHDPSDGRSAAPGTIASAANRIGLSITDDTVRKYLKEAKSLKGFDASIAFRKKPNSGRA
jgi:BMFP domain-containing protein YqiC